MEQKITSITLARLNNEEHVQFHRSVLSLMEQAGNAATGMEKLYTIYLQAFSGEAEALDIMRSSEVSRQITEQDSLRDSIFRGFSDTVKGSRNHFDATVRAAAGRLWNILLHYGNITAKTLDAETAAIYDLLREFANPEPAAALETLQLTGWRDRLKAENEQFHKLVMERYSEASGKTVYRMKTARIETDKYYRAVAAQTGILLLTGNNSAAFSNFVIEFNAVVKRFKDLLAQDFGRNAKSQE